MNHFKSFQLNSVLAGNGLFLGGSCRPTATNTRALIDSHANHVRVYLHWKYFEPVLTEPVNTTLTVDYLRAHPADIYRWATKRDWSNLDLRVGFYDHAPHVNVIGEVGEGTVQGLPLISKHGDVFDPNVVGKQTYLAYIYRAARAVVARYKHRITVWQIENELNQAWLAMFAGQRRLQFLASIWADFDFLTDLLKTLKLAVVDEQPSGKVFQNVATDPPAWLADILFLKNSFYTDAIKHWYPFLDYIALDGIKLSN
jgi:hypothetical protein